MWLAIWCDKHVETALLGQSRLRKTTESGRAMRNAGLIRRKFEKNLRMVRQVVGHETAFLAIAKSVVSALAARRKRATGGPRRILDFAPQ